MNVLFLILMLVQSAAHASGPFSLRIYTLPRTPDWLTENPEPHRYIMHNILEGLLIRRPDLTVAPAPGISMRLEPGANGAGTWIFTIDPRNKWSDGKPVLAADFVRGWNRAKTLARSRNQEIIFRDIADFSAPDSRTIRLHAKVAGPRVLDVLTQSWFFPLRKEHLDRKFSLLPFPSNGPWTLVHWDRAKGTVKLERNALYPEKISDQAPDRVTFRVAWDLAKARTLFEQKELDFLTEADTGTVTQFTSPQSLRPSRFFRHELGYTDYLQFNLASEAMTDMNLRSALALTVSSDELCRDHNSGQIPVRSLLRKWLVGYSGPLVETKREQARGFLKKAAALRPGLAAQPLKMLFFDGEVSRKFAQSITEQLELHLGLHARVDFVPFDKLDSIAKNSQYDLVQRFYSPRGLYPDELFARFAGVFSDYDSLLGQLVGAEPPRQLEIYRNLEQMVLHNKIMAIPLAGGLLPVLQVQSVETALISPLNFLSLKDVVLRPEAASAQPTPTTQ